MKESDLQVILARVRLNMKGGDAPCTRPPQRPEFQTCSAAPSRTSGGASTKAYTAPQARRINKWEESYAAQELEPRRIVGEILWYGFEAIKLKLADQTYYTPDFAVLPVAGRLEFVEVKGFIRDDAAVKFKVAAAQFPFRFTMLRKRKVNEGGGWEVVRDLNARKE